MLASPDGTALLRAVPTLQSPRRIGLPHSAATIAGAGDSLGASDRLAKISRVFALNTDRTLWLNSGAGCDSAWRRIDHPFVAEEIAARSVDQIYALNTDKTLRHAVWISNFNSNNLQLRLTPDAIVLEIDFAPGGKVTVDTAIQGNWDIQNAKLTLTLGISDDLCGLSRLTLKSTRSKTVEASIVRRGSRNGQLMLTHRTRFTDGSRRRDYSMTEYFTRR